MSEGEHVLLSIDVGLVYEEVASAAKKVPSHIVAEGHGAFLQIGASSRDSLLTSPCDLSTSRVPFPYHAGTVHTCQRHR